MYETMYKNFTNLKNVPKNVIEEKKKELENIFINKKKEIKKEIEKQLDNYIKNQLDSIFGK
jgi:BMFP domain-containing protein YqiC